MTCRFNLACIIIYNFLTEVNLGLFIVIIEFIITIFTLEPLFFLSVNHKSRGNSSDSDLIFFLVVN